MLLHAILLLLGSLALADADCELAKIKGPASAEISYDPLTVKKLKCTAPNDQIEYAEKLYAELECKPTGWTSTGAAATPLDPAVSAGANLDVKCVAKACHKSLITGFSALKMSYPDKELTCTDAGKTTVKYIDADGTTEKFASLLKCDPGANWADTTIKPDKPISVECVAKACDLSLIQGKTSDMSYAGQELKCNAANKPVVKYKDADGTTDKFASPLKCLSTWADSTIQAYQSITVVDCVAKACDQSLINGFDDTTMTYVGYDLKCDKEYKILKYNDAAGAPKEASKLTCPSTGVTWQADNVDTGVNANGELTVAGCNIVPCHEKLITQTGAQFSATGTLTCTVPTHVLSIVGVTSSTYAKLVCAEGTGWTDGASSGMLKRDIEPFTVSCAAVVPTDCVPPTGFDYEPTTGTLTCSSTTSLSFIQVGGTDHSHLKCKAATQEWTNDAGAIIAKVGDLQNPLTCVKYCAVDDIGTPSGPVLVLPGTPGEIVANCPAPPPPKDYGLFYTDPAAAATNKVTAAELKCEKGVGWKDGDNIIATDKPALKLECREACNNFKRIISSTNLDEFGLTTDAQIVPGGSGVEIQCTVKVLGSNNGKNAIKLNGKFVFSHLKCNANDGYTDVFGVPLGPKAFEEVLIECKESPCPKSGGPVCDSLSSTDVVEGYACVSPKDPFEVTNDDPNLLKCGPLSKLIELTPKKFFDKPPRCNEDSKWHKYDDAGTSVAIDDLSDLGCLRKRCNTCSALAKLMAPGEAFTTIDGTADECAKIKCPSTANLWYITKTVGGPHEQYAGEVTCASKKKKEGKWLIDGVTEIAEASCIPAGDIPTVVKCTEAAPLSTTCVPAWEGCDQTNQLTPSDDTEARCAPNMMMFYTQNVEHGFEEDGEKIACVKATGLWTITKKDRSTEPLKRGGTVICGMANPKPTTTTLAPTTPSVPACAECPKVTAETLLKCDACSKKDTDLQQSSENGGCAYNSWGGLKKIETEKAGQVDKLLCNKTDKIWTTTDGKDPGKFAAAVAAQEQEQSYMVQIVAGSVGGSVFLIIVFAVIFKVFVAKKKPEDKDEETRRKMLEEEKKKKNKKAKAGDNNDEILDDQVVDAPSELKL